MNIYEAMQARTRVQPAIRRKAWDYWLTVGNEKRPMVMQPKYRIIPTNTPEGCLIEPEKAESPSRKSEPEKAESPCRK